MGKADQSNDSPLPLRLKNARLAKGLSQKALGIAAGMDEFSASPRMNHYERGRHAPDFNALRRLARLLEVPTAYFYAEEEWLAAWLIKLPKLDPASMPDQTTENSAAPLNPIAAE